jgi:hypothetical protein
MVETQDPNGGPTFDGGQDEMFLVGQSSGYLETSEKIVDEPEPEVVMVVKPIILLAAEPEVELGRDALWSLED